MLLHFLILYFGIKNKLNWITKKRKLLYMLIMPGHVASKTKKRHNKSWLGHFAASRVFVRYNSFGLFSATRLIRSSNQWKISEIRKWHDFIVFKDTVFFR